MLVSEERGKLEYLEKNLLEQGREQRQTQPTFDAGLGIALGTRRWEASALTTAPSLLPLVADLLIILVV